MPRYFSRWLVAVFGVAPVMLLLVPAAQLLLWGLEGPHANDSLWEHFLGMLGFYGGYVLVAATVVSLLHTWLVRRFPRMERAPQVLLAVALGTMSLMPQAAVFGEAYWAVNLAAGATAGALYGLVAMRRDAPVSAER
jgi:hypothetical protein